MKISSYFLISLLLLLFLIAGCDNSKGKDLKTEKNISGKGNIIFMLGDRRIASSDYYCGWKRTDNINLFSLTVFYDRVANETPPNVGFLIHNLKDIQQPISRLNGNLPGFLGQQFSLGASMALPTGKAANMNESSFSDNYPGLFSNVELTRLDTIAKLVSGKFEGTVKNANGRGIKIENGQFEDITVDLVF
jgi:hypothetical protein